MVSRSVVSARATRRPTARIADVNLRHLLAIAPTAVH